MFESVIVPLDASPMSARAVPAGAAIAAAAGCPLVLLTVSAPAEVTDTRWLHRLADGLGIPDVQLLERVGADAAATILGVEAEHPGALLCMATSAHTGVTEIVFGSVAAEIVRHARRPLVVVGPNAGPVEELRTIQVCLDGSELAEAGARTGAVWASMLGAEVHLVRVAPPSEPGDPHDAATDLQRVSHGLRDGLGVRATWDVLHGSAPGAELVRYARSAPSSLVVITTHGETGAVERLLGSTAMRVVHDAPCPVLLVPR